VIHTDFTTIRDFNAIVNEGTDKRETTIVSKTGLHLQNRKHIPSGRGIATIFQGICIINIYAPSSAEKRVDRECFFNSDDTPLLPTDPAEVIIAVDFNSVISPAACTGKPTTSRALVTLIKRMGLRDVWETYPHIPAHTLQIERQN
jgi:hypothetical protein